MKKSPLLIQLFEILNPMKIDAMGNIPDSTRLPKDEQIEEPEEVEYPVTWQSWTMDYAGVLHVYGEGNNGYKCHLKYSLSDLTETFNSDI